MLRASSARKQPGKQKQIPVLSGLVICFPLCFQYFFLTKQACDITKKKAREKLLIKIFSFKLWEKKKKRRKASRASIFHNLEKQ